MTNSLYIFPWLGINKTIDFWNIKILPYEIFKECGYIKDINKLNKITQSTLIYHDTFFSFSEWPKKVNWIWVLFYKESFLFDNQDASLNSVILNEIYKVFFLIYHIGHTRGDWLNIWHHLITSDSLFLKLISYEEPEYWWFLGRFGNIEFMFNTKPYFVKSISDNYFTNEDIIKYYSSLLNQKSDLSPNIFSIFIKSYFSLYRIPLQDDIQDIIYFQRIVALITCFEILLENSSIDENCINISNYFEKTYFQEIPPIFNSWPNSFSSKDITAFTWNIWWYSFQSFKGWKKRSDKVHTVNLAWYILASLYEIRNKYVHTWETIIDTPTIIGLECKINIFRAADLFVRYYFISRYFWHNFPTSSSFSDFLALDRFFNLLEEFIDFAASCKAHMRNP